jgi:hypothetical protein
MGTVRVLAIYLQAADEKNFFYSKHCLHMTLCHIDMAMVSQVLLQLRQ